MKQIRAKNLSEVPEQIHGKEEHRWGIVVAADTQYPHLRQQTNAYIAAGLAEGGHLVAPSQTQKEDG